jgi:FkbM family methyltransferase
MFRKIKNYINVKFKSTYYNLYKRLGSEFVNSAYGIKFKKNWSDKTFVFYIKGSYGNYLRNHILSQKKPFIFMDIGANQGLYSIVAGKSKNCTHTYAFEPVRKIYKLCVENVVKNKVFDKVDVIPSAISDVNEFLKINITKGHSGKASLRDYADDTYFEYISSVNHESLSKMIRCETRMVVKIDVEGHEEVVIDELFKATFASKIDTLFFEVDERHLPIDKVTEFLKEKGFKEFIKIDNNDRNTFHYDILALK